ncbi:MAG: glycosyltransferase family 2 protein [Patescibacteria group bacterium]
MEFVIITPSFNQKKFLKQTLTSVKQQSVKVNHWVFDGGSNDGSKELLTNQKDIYFESKPDKGQADAINKGIRKLETWLKENHKDPNQIIFAYLNSDDYYLSDALKKVQQVFEKNKNVKWLVGDCVIFNENNHEIQQPIRLYKQFWRWFISKPVLSILNPIPQPSVFIRASEVIKTGLFNASLHYVMDYEYWLRLLNKIGKPEIMTEPIAAFRIHKNSKGASQFKNQFAEQYSVVKKFTKNKLLLNLQKFHNAIIIHMYRLLK